MTSQQHLAGPQQYRSVWISDVHLGTKHAQIGPLLDFLRASESRYLYIVGDLIDGWELRRKWFWRDEYNLLFQKLLRKSRRRTQITYITGNHDEFIEGFLGLRFGSVKLAAQAIHTGVDGRRYLVIHGHQCDGVAHFSQLFDRVGSRIYQWLLDVNIQLNRIRRRLGFGYWSLAAYLKHQAKRAVKQVSNYEEALAQMARKQNLDGVICGHIHRAEIRTINGVEYLNCGDWVENCTALVEEFDGRIHLVQFTGSRSSNSAPAFEGDGTTDKLGSAMSSPVPSRRRRRHSEPVTAELFPDLAFSARQDSD